MPVHLRGTRYFSLGEVADLVERHRTTLWRWRRQGKIPPGLRYCDHQLCYTDDEVEQIFAYAHRLAPADARRSFQEQFDLFARNRP